MNNLIFLPAPESIRVCIDDYEDGNYSGRIYSIYEAARIPFFSLDNVIVEIYNHLDKLGRPESSEAIRTFKKRKKPERKKEEEVLPLMRSREDIRHKHGDLGTFVVHVKYRQNATMQGEVIWTETGEKQNFRSAYELMTLIDSATRPVVEFSLEKSQI